jgi:hypothetical protein
MVDWMGLLFIQKLKEVSCREYYFKQAIRLSFDLNTDMISLDMIVAVTRKVDFTINVSTLILHLVHLKGTSIL